MSAEFWIGFMYGVCTVALPVCGVAAYVFNARVQRWLDRERWINAYEADLRGYLRPAVRAEIEARLASLKAAP